MYKFNIGQYIDIVTFHEPYQFNNIDLVDFIHNNVNHCELFGSCRTYFGRNNITVNRRSKIIIVNKIKLASSTEEMHMESKPWLEITSDDIALIFRLSFPFAKLV